MRFFEAWPGGRGVGYWDWWGQVVGFHGFGCLRGAEGGATSGAMKVALLRALVGVVAVLGAMWAPEGSAPRLDGVQREVVWTAGPHGEAGSDEDSGRKALALLGESAPVSLVGSEESGDGPRSAGKRSQRMPRPRPVVPALDPRECGALAPGERPAALAYLRANGSANANGAGT